MKSKPRRDTGGYKLLAKVLQAGVKLGYYHLFSALGSALFLIGLALFAIYKGVPWYIGGFMIFSAALIMAVGVISIKKTAGMNPDSSLLCNSNQEPGANRLATTIQKVEVTAGFQRIVNTLSFSALLIALGLFCIYLKIPWFIGTAMIFIAIAVVIIDIIRQKRIAGVDLITPSEAILENIVLEPGECLADTIPAVMQYGKNRSVEVLGTGKVLTPENALIITNRAVWALTVPLAGADKVVGGTDIGMWQWMTTYQDIVDTLQEMITTLPLDEVLKQGRAQRLMSLEEIKSAKTLPFTYAISLRRRDGKKFGYSVRVKEDYLRAKEIFKIG